MLTDDEVSFLCDIGQGSSTFEETKKHEVVNLLARGYIERDGPQFRVTETGQKALAKRGAGLNEARTRRRTCPASLWPDQTAYPPARHAPPREPG